MLELSPLCRHEKSLLEHCGQKETNGSCIKHLPELKVSLEPNPKETWDLIWDSGRQRVTHVEEFGRWLLLSDSLVAFPMSCRWENNFLGKAWKALLSHSTIEFVGNLKSLIDQLVWLINSHHPSSLIEQKHLLALNFYANSPFVRRLDHICDQRNCSYINCQFLVDTTNRIALSSPLRRVGNKNQFMNIFLRWKLCKGIEQREERRVESFQSSWLYLNK